MARFSYFITVCAIVSVFLIFVSGCSESRPATVSKETSSTGGGALEYVTQNMPAPLKVSGDYKPPTIVIDSPQNGMIYPFGTANVDIRGRVVQGTAGIWELQVLLNGKGKKVTEYNKKTGEFSYRHDLEPVPPGENRTFQITDCMFQVFDLTGRSNCERVVVIVAEHSLRHGDPSVKKESLIEVSMTEEVLEEGSEYMSQLFNMLLPDVLDRVLPLSVNTRDLIGFDLGRLTVDSDIESSPCAININCGKPGAAYIGEVSDLIINTVPGNKIRGSLKVYPKEGPYGNHALFLSGYHGLNFLFGKKRVHFQVESDYVELTNIGLKVEVNPSGEILFIPDFTDVDIDLGNANVDYGDIAMAMPEWLLSGVVDLILPIFGRLGFEIGLPLMNINDLVLDADTVISLLETISIEADVPESGSVIHTTDDAMSTRLGISMEIKEWDENALNPAADSFVSTPGKEMPSIMADTRKEGEDMVAVISDEIMNQAAFVLVQSGTLQNLLDDIDIIDVVKNNMPELSAFILKNSPDLEVKTQLTTPPVFDFSGGPEMSYLEGFGNAYISNFIIELNNVMFEGLREPENFKLAIDLYAAIGLKISDDNRRIQAEITFIDPENTMDIKVLYSSFPGAVLINPLLSMVRGIIIQLMDSIIPEMLSIHIPMIDEMIGFELPVIEITETELIDNCLVAKLDLGFR